MSGHATIEFMKVYQRGGISLLSSCLILRNRGGADLGYSLLNLIYFLVFKVLLKTLNATGSCAMHILHKILRHLQKLFCCLHHHHSVTRILDTTPAMVINRNLTLQKRDQQKVEKEIPNYKRTTTKI